MKQLQKMVARKKRLVSLDALRGFNMLWIIGADRIADALKELHFPGAKLVSAQLNHASWNGFTSNDLIYPLFIFLVGVSLTFAVQRRITQGSRPGQILRHILIRSGVLFLIGLYLCNAGRGWQSLLHPESLRWMGVLQRIAICYCFTGLLVLGMKLRHQILTATFLLVGYWMLMRFIPVPGYGAGVWSPQANFANYFDDQFLPGHLYYETWDPEGLLSTLPAIANCLFGVFTGYWLQSKELPEIRIKNVVLNRKLVYLVLAGLTAVGIGLVWSLDFPLNKKIWTSSFAVLCGGLSALLMALFYWLVDLRGHQKEVFPLVVVGLNSLFIYVVAAEVPITSWVTGLLGNPLLTALGSMQTLSVAILTLFLEWLLLYGMYKFKLFVKL